MIINLSKDELITLSTVLHRDMPLIGVTHYVEDELSCLGKVEKALEKITSKEKTNGKA